MDGLSIQRQRHSERLSERLVNRLHQLAQAEIRQTLTVYGYYRPTITVDLQQTVENQWLANYQIEVGEPVRITDLQIAVSGAGEQDIAFQVLQVILRGKYIKRLTETSRFITRGQIGATSVSDFNQLPSSLRYFAGGDNSIRGFDYQSLGPENDKDEVVGGRYMAVASIEYENMFYGNWGGAVFTDFGNAFNDWSDPFEYSVGFGVRWRSPVGLIRLDIAQGISDKDKPIGLHIVIGPDL